MYATLINLPCWIVLHSLWKIITRSQAKARWSSQNTPSQFLGIGEVRRQNSDTDSLAYPMETPKELEARSIEERPKIQDGDGDGAIPRLRTRRQGAGLQSDPSPGSWWKRLEGREVTILAQ